MKPLSLFTVLMLLFATTACNQNDHQTKASHTQNSVQMKQLSTLVEHAIAIMAQGAELKLYGQQDGDHMLTQSADLLRRAMSGPEMAEMHKTEKGHSPAMQYTHNLGAAAFDLLDLMMSLKEPSNIKNIHLLHQALNIAAEGASLKSLINAKTNQELAKAIQQQGRDIQQLSSNLSQTLNHEGAYPQAVLKVIKLLTHNTKKNMPETH